MVNISLLKAKINESGMTMSSLARLSSIRRETLYNRINKKGEFTASEIVSLTRVLHLTKDERDSIFLQ